MACKKLTCFKVHKLEHVLEHALCKKEKKEKERMIHSNEKKYMETAEMEIYFWKNDRLFCKTIIAHRDDKHF